MRNRDAFSSYHPSVNFLYFGWVIGFSMFFMHPVCLLISLCSALAYYISLTQQKSAGYILRLVLPMLILTALINPAFNHQGNMILCYLPTGNALTLESVLYGLAAGAMLAAVLVWFGCYTDVMTSDKFIYLFGTVIPTLSLVLSMTLRFVPKFREQYEQVKEAQAGVGRDVYNGSVFSRLKHALACFGVMVTWSLENAIETADSMKSRGYGLPDRTAYSIYHFTQRDRYVFIWLCLSGLYVLVGGLSGGLFWRYFPSVRGVLVQPYTVSVQLVYLALCMTPVIIDWREERKWRSLRSSI